MYFKLSKGTAFRLLIGPLGIMSLCSSAQEINQPAQTIEVSEEVNVEETPKSTMFSVQPAMCVALTQGRTCYANVTIEWATNHNGSFCIYQKSPQKNIKCWKHLTQGVFKFEFESKESVTYQLINNQNDPVAETTIDVSWVHKKSLRKRRWRLF